MSLLFFFDTIEYVFGRQGKPDYLIEQTKGPLRASLRLYKQANGHWAGHRAAPFGFISIEKKSQIEFDSDINNIYKILAYDIANKMLDILMLKYNAQSISLVAFPRIYDHLVYDSFADALESRGFAAQLPSDISFVIQITHKNGFYEGIDADQKYKIRRATKEGFIFDKEPVSRLALAWQLLETNRAAKSYSLSLDYNQMLSHFVHFAGRYMLFSVSSPAADLAAIAIAVWVRADILYVFYVADAMEYRKSSPVVLLYQGLYKYAYSKGARLLDLGIATANGLPNPGLMAFKKSLGAISTPKQSWNWKPAD